MKREGGALRLRSPLVTGQGPSGQHGRGWGQGHEWMGKP